MNINHFGSNVGVVSGFPYRYNKNSIYAAYGDKNINFAPLAEQIAQAKYKYLFAITANYTQDGSPEMLQEQGFREVVTFQSSHANKEETLTLWTKTQKKFEDLSQEPTIIHGYKNCTVTYSRDEVAKEYELAARVKICVTLFREGDTVKALKAAGYKRIRATPIWFRIAEDRIVKKPVDKEQKAK